MFSEYLRQQKLKDKEEQEQKPSWNEKPLYGIYQ